MQAVTTKFQGDPAIGNLLGTSLILFLAYLLTGCASSNVRQADIRINDTQVFPESITSMSDGTVISGSVKGIVYRAEPNSGIANPWISHSPENGILTILGVLADEKSNTLWLCSVPNFFGPERSKKCPKNLTKMHPNLPEAVRRTPQKERACYSTHV